MSSQLIVRLENYFKSYLSFANGPESYPFALALYAIGTYMFRDFDAYGYVAITSETKRSGKSRLGELMSFVTSNPRLVSGPTFAAIMRMIASETPPTLIIDEAETLSKEAASDMRSFMNVGYRKGQSFPRATGDEVVDWPTYCPKIFILIGDVFDTLRDRSILIRMRRGEAPKRFTFAEATAEGKAISEEIKGVIAVRRQAIVDAYATAKGLPYLPDRDEEIWMSLFAICSVLHPERLPELERIATDMSVDKTAPIKKHRELSGAEDEAIDDEFSKRLLQDMVAICGTREAVTTQEMLDALHAIPTAPWRRYKGTGINAHNLGDILDRFGVGPRVFRVGKGRKNSKTLRGYRREDLAVALARL